MLLKAVDISNLTGTTRANISFLTKKNRLIKNADGKYDINDPVNKSYLSGFGLSEKEIKVYVLSHAEEKEVKKLKKGEGQNKKEKKVKKVKEVLSKSELKPIEVFDSEGIAKLLGLPEKCLVMTIEQLVLEYQTIPNLKLYAETLDKMLSAAKRSVEIQRIKNELIDRSFVKSHIVNYLNILSSQLFDYAGDDEKLCKDFTKIVQHTQKQIDREFEKLEIIKEAQNGNE